MATSFIEGAAQDFDARLQQQHKEAMDRFFVQDTVRLGIMLGRAATDSFPTDQVPKERNESLQHACRLILKAITFTRYAVNECQTKGHEVAGVAEMDEVALDLRFMLTELQNQLDGAVEPRAISLGRSDQGPPDSWYLEDQSKLCGPFC